MRVLVLGLLVAVLAAARASAHTPFEPLASSPDHVVTMIASDGPAKKERVVTHHGEWTRVDTAWDGRRATQYVKRDEAVTVRSSEGKAGEYGGFSIILGPERLSDWDHTPIKTNERQTFLGEACTVWEVLRARNPGPARPQLTRTSCVTDDGIELWYKVANPSYVFSRAEATRVERRPVTSAEVQPPRGLFDLDPWFENAALPTKTPPDFEAVLEQAGDAKATRTIRRRGGWTSIAVNSGTALQTLDISHGFGSFKFRFDAATSTARAQIGTMTLRSPPISGPPLPSFVPQDMGKTEIVLGEQCRWYNLMPGVSDGYEAACRTRDGDHAEGGVLVLGQPHVLHSRTLCPPPRRDG